MALQDLTPQLRTRLSRMERAVGWFVIFAVALLAFGFGYYVYNTAERKGWFRTKAPYFTFTTTASGLKVGDPVTLMGRDVGQITKIEPMAPEVFAYNMYVEFEIRSPYYGYLWTEGSRAVVAPATLLGNRAIEVTKGTNGYPTYVFHPLRTVSLSEVQYLPNASNWVLAEEIFDPNGTNLLAKPLQPLTNLSTIAAAGYSNLVVMDASTSQKLMTGVWDDKEGRYNPYTNGVSKYWLLSAESPAVSEQLQKMVGEVEQGLPHILSLTNALLTVLANSAELTSNLNVVAVTARPVVSNLAAATAHLDHPGALGEWLLPTNINDQLGLTLSNASSTLGSANTNLPLLVENLNRSLDNLANITSNLNQQVEANTNLLSSVSGAVVHADQFVQGLKRFWLFRHLFKSKETNAPPPSAPQPIRSPKENGER